MMQIDIVRAWKDAHYRKHLTLEEKASLPENPVGWLELTDDELAVVQGAHAAVDHVVTAAAICDPATTIGKCNTIGYDCRFNF